jgi:NAD(P)-dependent dehydrogenase (short-subunit alcohol dehydrogenase family)
LSSNAQDQVVIVTGAFGALGSAVARRFAAAGATVALLDREGVPADLAREFQGSHLLIHGVDLADMASTAKAINSVVGLTSRIDALVNVAGGFRWETLESGDIATWELMFSMNLKTAVNASRATLPHLQVRGGSIVNVGAGAAARAQAGMGAYTASKAGVERLTEALAEELKDYKVRVNCVLPGVIDTPQNRTAMPKADLSRWVAPAAIADVIHFLASDAARAVNGASVRVFGRG